MWVLSVIAWVVVVIAGSALTWVAISRAGGQVTADPSAEVTQPAVIGTVGPAPMPTRTPRHPRSTHPTSTTSETTSGPSTPPPTRTASPIPTPSRTPSTAPQTVTRTWSGQAGSVTVACTGATARFRSASPSNGWSFERSDDSGSEVEVTFQRDQTEVQVKASCVGGVPRFRVESGSDSGSSGEH